MTDKMMTSTFSELLYQTYSSYLFSWATEIEFVLKKHKQSCGRKLPRLYPFGFILICFNGDLLCNISAKTFFFFKIAS
jgi:hypothetical protein